MIYRKARQGFTIVELLMVVAVIGTLATILLVSYGGTSSKAVDTSILSDLDRMEGVQTRYGINNNTGGKLYYSGLQNNPGGYVYDSELDFKPTPDNVIDVSVDSTDYCIRGYNTAGSYNSIATAAIKESTEGVCSTLGASASAIAESP